MLGLVIGGSGLVIGTIMRTENRSGNLPVALTYLREIEDLAWVEFDGNDVYLGVKSRALPDLRSIVHAAALNGNRATGFGVHVWATVGRRGWRPGTPGFICQATARGGVLEDECVAAR